MIEASTENVFRAEIDQLLDQVRPEILADASVRVVHYSYIPWHEESSISFGTHDDEHRFPHTPADWTYFMAVQSDAARLGDLIRSYDRASDARVTYHSQLIAAASALLATDPTTFPEIPHGPTETMRRSFVHDRFPNHLFKAEVTDPDQSLTFNYCEYVLGQRLSSSSRISPPT